MADGGVLIASAAALILVCVQGVLHPLMLSMGVYPADRPGGDAEADTADLEKEHAGELVEAEFAIRRRLALLLQAEEAPSAMDHGDTSDHGAPRSEEGGGGVPEASGRQDLAKLRARAPRIPPRITWRVSQWPLAAVAVLVVTVLSL